MNFANIKRNYDRGLWTAAMVKVAVKKGVITHDEYETITGKSYGDTPEEVQAMLTAKVQKCLDTTAQKLGYEIVAAVRAGTRSVPTEAELFAELPAIELDREELK